MSLHLACSQENTVKDNEVHRFVISTQKFPMNINIEVIIIIMEMWHYGKQVAPVQHTHAHTHEIIRVCTIIDNPMQL